MPDGTERTYEDIAVEKIRAFWFTELLRHLERSTVLLSWEHRRARTPSQGKAGHV